MSARANPVVRWLAAAASRIFYRIDRIGEAPREGALLLLPNHPNALLDPAIVWATAGRDVRFLAKSTLFNGPLRPILQGAGAIPVYRKQDQGVDTSRNADMFRAVDAALAGGDAVCLFPEGISHSKGRLEPLRTGAARMALAAEQRGTRLALVAVGLNFDSKMTFRSRVTVVFGPPFDARDLLPPGDEGLPAAVRALTDRIASHLRRLLVEADPHGDAALVERVDRLYASARGRPSHAEDRLARRRIIAGGIERLRSGDPDRYGQILMKLRRYDQRLQRFGLRDRHLDWEVRTADAVRFAARELAIALLLVPLALAGLILFFVPYRLTGFAAARFTREHDVIATAQVVSGFLTYGAWIALLGAAAWYGMGRVAGIAALLALPVLAVASLVALEREAAVLDTVRSWLLLRRARHETRERLRRHRTELADVLDEVNAWLAGEREAR